jgi:hypothetical protein
LGLFIVGLTSIRGRRPDGGKLAFDTPIGQDWTNMKPSQPGSLGSTSSGYGEKPDTE